MNGFVRVALYARVSSQKQSDEMTILSQRQAVIDRITEDGFVLDPGFEFCDQGCSGSELYRPSLERLRDQIASSIIDRLYVLSPDRLARKFAHQALLLDEFSKHDCEIVFVNHQGLPDSPETNLLVQMQGMIAEYEREKILERTRRGRRYAAACGRMSVLSKAPYGYRYISKANGDGEARWEIDLLQSETVKLMFELVGQHRSTLAGVCRELKSREIATKTGKSDWDRSTVRGILINPAYTGQARYGKERLVPRKPGKRAKRGDPALPRRAKVAVATSLAEQVTISVPPILSQSLFERVQQQMEENRKRQRVRQAGPKHLLSGLTLCGQCGSAYCTHKTVDGKYRYYRCLGTESHRHQGKKICDNGSVKGQELEARVWSEVCELLRDPARLVQELERRQQQSSDSDELLALQRRIDELRGRLDRLIDAYTNGLLEKSEFEKRITPLRANHDREIAALASLRGRLENEEDWEHVASGIELLSQQVENKLSTASEELKREVIMLLIKQIEIHPKEVRIVYRVPPPPFEMGHESGHFLQHCWRRQLIAWGKNWEP
jgi:site-specific DNA recombinase